MILALYGVPGFWDFLCGRVKRIMVRMQQLPIPKQFIDSDYENDPECRDAFQQWLSELWKEKDGQIGQLYVETRSA